MFLLRRKRRTSLLKMDMSIGFCQPLRSMTQHIHARVLLLLQFVRIIGQAQSHPTVTPRKLGGGIVDIIVAVAPGMQGRAAHIEFA